MPIGTLSPEKFSEVIETLRESSTGIWYDTDPTQDKMNSYLREDIFTSPRFREHENDASLL